MTETKKKTPRTARREEAVKKQLAEMAEAEVEPKVEEAPKELTTIQKVQLMSSLANIATDEAVATMLKERPNGNIVYDIFIEAVDKKLKEIMDGKPEEIPQQVTSILAATGRIDITLKEFQRMIMGFMDTPLVEVLNLMNRNLGGKKFDFDRDKIDNAAPAAVYEQPRQQPQPRPQTTQQPRQQPVHQNEQEQPVGYNPHIRSGGGVGSF